MSDRPEYLRCRVPVFHRAGSGDPYHVAYYWVRVRGPGEIVRNTDIQNLDGTNPPAGRLVRWCPICESSGGQFDYSKGRLEELKEHLLRERAMVRRARRYLLGWSLVVANLSVGAGFAWLGMWGWGALFLAVAMYAAGRYELLWRS